MLKIKFDFFFFFFFFFFWQLVDTCCVSKQMHTDRVNQRLWKWCLGRLFVVGKPQKYHYSGLVRKGCHWSHFYQYLILKFKIFELNVRQLHLNWKVLTLQFPKMAKMLWQKWWPVCYTKVLCICVALINGVTRIKSEIIEAPKVLKKNAGKPNWAIQLFSFLSFSGGIFLAMK